MKSKVLIFTVRRVSLSNTFTLDSAFLFFKTIFRILNSDKPINNDKNLWQVHTIDRLNNTILNNMQSKSTTKNKNWYRFEVRHRAHHRHRAVRAIRRRTGDAIASTMLPILHLHLLMLYQYSKVCKGFEFSRKTKKKKKRNGRVEDSIQQPRRASRRAIWRSSPIDPIPRYFQSIQWRFFEVFLWFTCCFFTLWSTVYDELKRAREKTKNTVSTILHTILIFDSILFYRLPLDSRRRLCTGDAFSCAADLVWNIYFANF